MSKLQGGHFIAGMVQEIVSNFIGPKVYAENAGSNFIVVGRYGTVGIVDL